MGGCPPGNSLALQTSLSSSQRSPRRAAWSWAKVPPIDCSHRSPCMGAQRGIPGQEQKASVPLGSWLHQGQTHHHRAGSLSALQGWHHVLPGLALLVPTGLSCRVWLESRSTLEPPSVFRVEGREAPGILRCLSVLFLLLRQTGGGGAWRSVDSQLLPHS